MDGIRLATAHDSAAVLTFYESAIESMRANLGGGWKKGVYPTGAYLDQMIAQQELFLLLEEGAILAAVVLNHRADDAFYKAAWQVDAKPEEVLVVHTLASSPDRHRTGLASRMMDFAAELGRARGCKALRLDVWGPNKPAHAFYQKNGFRPGETIRMYYEDTGLDNFTLYERLL